jgi:hypothetical protein
MATNHTADALLARLIKLTRRREDFVTECFAAVLQADHVAASAYWRELTATLSSSIRSTTGPVMIETQLSAGKGSSRLDMVVTRGRHRIAVEHKLGSRQGQNQLPKYASLPKAEASHVALVTGDYQTVAEQVLNSRRYVKPRGNLPHFLWADFYGILEKSKSEIASATKGLFDRIGLQPAHKHIGDLRTADAEKQSRFDARLLVAWQPLIGSLKRSGWSVTSAIPLNRKSELWVTYGPSDLLREVRVDPASNPSDLRIQLRTSSPQKRNEILAHVLERYPGAEPVRLPKSGRGNHWAVEIRTSWRLILKRTKTRAALGEALKRFVLRMMRCADESAV